METTNKAKEILENLQSDLSPIFEKYSDKSIIVLKESIDGLDLSSQAQRDFGLIKAFHELQVEAVLSTFVLWHGVSIRQLAELFKKGVIDIRSKDV